MTIHDISVALHADLPTWPNSEPILISTPIKMSDGADANVSHLSLNLHAGTHIDAPLHFVKDGKTTLDISMEKLVGPCYVADLRGLEKITAADLERADIPPDTSKLLLKTDNSQHWDNPAHPFYENFCALTADAAQWVVNHHIHLVGIDYLSIQLFHDPIDTHVILLQAETVIVETLDLRAISPGNYRLICLPIKVKGVEGVSARAILEQP